MVDQFSITITTCVYIVQSCLEADTDNICEVITRICVHYIRQRLESFVQIVTLSTSHFCSDKIINNKHGGVIHVSSGVTHSPDGLGAGGRAVSVNTAVSTGSATNTCEWRGGRARTGVRDRYAAIVATFRFAFASSSRLCGQMELRPLEGARLCRTCQLFVWILMKRTNTSLKFRQGNHNPIKYITFSLMKVKSHLFEYLFFKCF